MQKLSDGSAKADMLASKDSGKSLAQCFLANKKDGAQVPKGLQGACRWNRIWEGFQHSSVENIDLFI